MYQTVKKSKARDRYEKLKREIKKKTICFSVYRRHRRLYPA